MRVHILNQSGSSRAEPSTTKRGNSASPTNSCTNEMAAAPVKAAPTAEPSMARLVRGTSGRPKPYAQTQRIPAYAMVQPNRNVPVNERSEEHTSELQSLMRISYAVFCLIKNK